MKSFVICNLSDSLKRDNNNPYNLRGHCFKLLTSFSNLNIRKYFLSSVLFSYGIDYLKVLFAPITLKLFIIIYLV